MNQAAPAISASDAADLGLRQAPSLLRERQLSATELTDACLRRIEARNGDPPTHDGAPEAITAWARIYLELAREQARAADEHLERQGETAPILCDLYRPAIAEFVEAATFTDAQALRARKRGRRG